MLVLVLMVMVVMAVLVVVVVVAAAALVLVLGHFGGEAVKLGLEGVLALHRGAKLRPVQLVPGGGDDDGALVVLAQHVHAGGELALAHALGAAEHDGSGVLDLIAPELAEVLHVHLGAGGVHDCGEAAGNQIGVSDVLYCADDVAELADAARLDEDAVGRELLLDLLERLGEVADQAAADAAAAHLGDLHAGVGQEAAVHADFAELVFDEHQLLARVSFGDQLLDKRRLSGAEKAGENVYFGHVFYASFIKSCVLQCHGETYPVNLNYTTNR